MEDPNDLVGDLLTLPVTAITFVAAIAFLAYPVTNHFNGQHPHPAPPGEVVIRAPLGERCEVMSETLISTCRRGETRVRCPGSSRFDVVCVPNDKLIPEAP